MHTLQVQLFSDLRILLLNVTAEHTLHSRVKDSITQNQDCCFPKIIELQSILMY